MGSPTPIYNSKKMLGKITYVYTRQQKSVDHITVANVHFQNIYLLFIHLSSGKVEGLQISGNETQNLNNDSKEARHFKPS